MPGQKPTLDTEYRRLAKRLRTTAASGGSLLEDDLRDLLDELSAAERLYAAALRRLERALAVRGTTPPLPSTVLERAADAKTRKRRAARAGE